VDEALSQYYGHDWEILQGNMMPYNLEGTVKKADPQQNIC
jgi:hypothetical protein